jgi:hypothetical protein
MSCESPTGGSGSQAKFSAELSFDEFKAFSPDELGEMLAKYESEQGIDPGSGGFQAKSLDEIAKMLAGKSTGETDGIIAESEKSQTANDSVLDKKIDEGLAQVRMGRGYEMSFEELGL